VLTWLAPLRMACAEPRQRVLVWVDAASDGALVERLQGQLSDLEIDLSVVEARPERVEPALALIWFTHPDLERDRIELHIADGSSREPYVRAIGDGASIAEGTLSSATLEAAALVVREALRDLAHREPPAAKAPSPPTPVLRRAAKLSPRPLGPRLAWRGEIGWHVVLDGLGWVRRQGPAFGLGVSYRSWAVEVSSAFSLPVSESDSYGTIRLRRQELGLRSRYEWNASRAVAIGVGLRAGIALYARSVERLSPSVVANGDRVTVSAAMGPELHFGWAPSAGPLELVVTGGLSVLPGAPRIGYQVDGQFEPSFSIWRLQPTLGVALAFRSNRDG
jgi:hypothetical protein